MKRLFTTILIILFLLTAMMPPGMAQVVSSMPHFSTQGLISGSMAEFHPVMIKGITIHPDNPFQFDFIIEMGDEKLESEPFKAESNKLIKYFLASLTVPEDQMWVNLSPYEKNRIIPEQFGQTEMGRDLLMQDYMLKQLT